MEDYKIFLGIDVSKDYFDIAMINNSEKLLEQERIEMNASGFDKLDSCLSQYNKRSILICFESTGIYHINLLIHLLNNNHKVYVVNPFLIKQYIRAVSLRKTKTDKKDALAISKYIKHSYHSLYPSSYDDLYNLRPLVRERESIIDLLTEIKTNIKRLLKQVFPELEEHTDIFTKTILELLLRAPSAKTTAELEINTINNILERGRGRKVSITAKEIKKLAEKSIGKYDKNLEAILVININKLFFLEEQLKKIDELINKNINNNEHLKSEVDILTSIDGIGDINAKNFIIEAGDINRFDNNKKFRAYIGTDPTIKQSGTSINTKGNVSKSGNAHLRKIIFLMAMSVSKCSKIFKDYFEKKCSEGKTYKQSIMSVANKLIGIIFSMLKNGTKFSEEIYSQIACSRRKQKTEKK